MKPKCSITWTTVFGLGLMLFFLAATPMTTFAQDKPAKETEKKDSKNEDVKSGEEEKEMTPRQKAKAAKAAAEAKREAAAKVAADKRAASEKAAAERRAAATKKREDAAAKREAAAAKKPPRKLTAAELAEQEEANAKQEKKDAKAAKKAEWKKTKAEVGTGSIKIRPINALAGNYGIMFDFPFKSPRAAFGIDMRFSMQGEVIETEVQPDLNDFVFYVGGLNLYYKYLYGENVYAQGIYVQAYAGGQYHNYEIQDIQAGEGLLETQSWKAGLLGGYQWRFGNFLIGAGAGFNYTSIFDRNIEFDNTTKESLDFILDVPYLPFDLNPELDITIGFVIK